MFAKLFKDPSGKVVIWQFPNLPLIGWAIFSVLARILPASKWQLAASYISFGFIFAWAWLEITNGVNYFRRILGAVVLLLSIHSRLG